MSKLIINIKLIGALFLVAFLASCSKVVLKVENIPVNTPKGAPIYVAGNFNFWDPGDSRYQLNKLADNTYEVTLPGIFGNVEYKFTRGDWSTEETDRCGFKIENRVLEHTSLTIVSHTIESWIDKDAINCDSVTIVITGIPKETKNIEDIKVAGNFNEWNPGDDSKYAVKLDSKGQMAVVLPLSSEREKGRSNIKYKLVKGDITNPEVDKFGSEIEYRELEFGKGDTVNVEVEKWREQIKPEDNEITIILTKIPEYTPKYDNFYLVGNFNGWFPGDDKYRFKKNKDGLYEISLARRKYGLSFKITRGDWDSEFTDGNGNKLDNQDYNYDEIDTLYYEVEGWLDIKRRISTYVTCIIDEYPENTPDDDILQIQIYELLEGVRASIYPFTKNQQGKYIAKVRRSQLTWDFVITRGSYGSQEVDRNGSFVPHRNLETQYKDTMYLKVEEWNDLIENDKLVKLTIIRLPKNTPEKDDIFITGQFNGWNPGNENYKLKMNNKEEYEIELPARWLKQGYKFTRGNWRKVESKNFNKYIENRVYRGNESNIEIKIESWVDKSIFSM